jgi:chloramphenicol-sensitive protein RarD
MHTGFLYAALAFTVWGLFPLYLHLIRQVPAFEVVLHRSTWALLFVLLLLGSQKRWQWLAQTRRQPKLLALFAFSALLLSANWLVYVYAVQTGNVVQASLGYFINPLVSVLLGVVVLRERLRTVQWVAVALAAGGVLWLTVQAGTLPWLALALAVSFGVYGLVRKTAPLGALEGLTLENMLLAPLVLPILAWWTWRHGGALGAAGHGDLTTLGWLLLGGPLTALPLLWFAAAARRLPLAMLGMAQYLSPSIQLLLAIWVFNEPFDMQRLVGFVFIWSALLLISADAMGLLRPRLPTPELPH